jgi:hypothetical protein
MHLQYIFFGTLFFVSFSENFTIKLHDFFFRRKDNEKKKTVLREGGGRPCEVGYFILPPLSFFTRIFFIIKRQIFTSTCRVQ